ncbi:MAG: DNA polymerase III subunit gamma/tau [Clostridia bacterium]|nr:DNA polymerase III subunit gamma/tau [Clostridia bacterium]
MAYTSLYRKYRPDTFDQVVGQDSIVKTLKNQIANDSIGHAYIFTGTRGTGKTTVAKIFAKAVNCLHPVDGSPCGKCEVCNELSNPANFDILELDAASNNSVDQVRDIIDKIKFTPTVGKYKVYIIDEVHMLSTAAFNALLKTLEEPPAHAVFILATTEINKIPATILSRCLRFDFRLVPDAVIADRISYIFSDCGVKAEKEAIKQIATSGNGSVRDALSIADMCVSYCNSNITYNGVLEVLGASDPEKLQQLCVSIADGDVESALTFVSELCDLGKSVPLLAVDIADWFRKLIYIKQCKDAQSLLAIPEGLYNKLKEVAEKYSVEKCMTIMRTITKLEGDLRYSTQHRILLESAVVIACLGGDEEAKIQELQMRVSKIEAYLKKAGKPSNFNSTPALDDARQVWQKVASQLSERGYQLLSYVVIEGKVCSEGDTIVIKYPVEEKISFLNTPDNYIVLSGIYKQLTTRPLKFEVNVTITEDRALQYVKQLFGDMLTVIK